MTGKNGLDNGVPLGVYSWNVGFQGGDPAGYGISLGAKDCAAKKGELQMIAKLCLGAVLCFPFVAQGGSIVADYRTIPDGTYPSITLAGTTVTGSSSVVSAFYAG